MYLISRLHQPIIRCGRRRRYDLWNTRVNAPLHMRTLRLVYLFLLVFFCCFSMCSWNTYATEDKKYTYTYTHTRARTKKDVRALNILSDGGALTGAHVVRGRGCNLMYALQLYMSLYARRRFPVHIEIIQTWRMQTRTDDIGLCNAPTTYHLASKLYEKYNVCVQRYVRCIGDGWSTNNNNNNNYLSL
jgi:hypothetical protein